MPLKIYLAGSIPKGDKARENFINWRDQYKKVLSSINNIEFLNPDGIRDESDAMEVFGHDINMIKNSDVVIINAEKKIGRGIGVGTSQEMVIAKYFSLPVITVIPKNTHHRRSNIVFHGKEIEDWIHPFIETFSDLIVEKVNDCIDWIKKYRNSPNNYKIKDIKIIDESIEYFLKSKEKQG